MREWLPIARMKRNLSQEEVAKSMGISAPHYSKIENGQRQMPMDLVTVWKLSHALGITPKEIMDKELCDLC